MASKPSPTEERNFIDWWIANRLKSGELKHLKPVRKANGEWRMKRITGLEKNASEK